MREPTAPPGLSLTGKGMRGDLDFERLVELHQGSLYRFALSLARNENDAADLVQQTFYLWGAKGHQLVDTTRVKTWLFTTLHREFLGRRRRLVRFQHLQLEEVEAELPETPPILPESLDWPALGACLERLDPLFRAPVALFYLEDYAYHEIAEILDVPLGTVKSRIARGIAQLQRMLIDHHVRQQPAHPNPS